jgi:hypothetical protein
MVLIPEFPGQTHNFFRRVKIQSAPTIVWLRSVVMAMPPSGIMAQTDGSHSADNTNTETPVSWL